MAGIPNNGRHPNPVPVPLPSPWAGLPPCPVPPAPIPTSFVVAQAPGPDGKMWVLLLVGTPAGQQVFWLPPEVAVNVSAQLGQAGKAGQVILPPT